MISFKNKNNEAIFEDIKDITIIKNKELNNKFNFNTEEEENKTTKDSKNKIIFNIPINQIEKIKKKDENEIKLPIIFNIPIDKVKNKSNENMGNKKVDTDFTSKDYYEENIDYEEEEEEEIDEEKPIFDIPVELIKNEEKKSN